MTRTLLVTNDFPPRHGGIQQYLVALADHLDPAQLVVYAPAWPGAAAFDATLPFPVHRHPTSLMLPGRAVARGAMDLLRRYGATTVWFGAAAPLALLGPGLRRRAGVERVVASTHGHEVGWAMLPGARHGLARIGRDADVVTTVSRYTRRRVAAAFGPAAVLEPLPAGVDCARFRPDPAAREQIRRRHGLGAAPVITCVSRLVARKGQDTLVRALPLVRARVPGARLLLVGDGPDAARLRRLAARCDVGSAVVFTGSVPHDALPAHHAAGDVFALPCRTRGGGLDVEGLGLAALEASACGLPVVVGAAGGAPETVRAGAAGRPRESGRMSRIGHENVGPREDRSGSDGPAGREGRTGVVIDGRDIAELADALVELLADPDLATAWGAAGRAWMQADWSWPDRAAHLRAFLDPEAPGPPPAARTDLLLPPRRQVTTGLGANDT